MPVLGKEVIAKNIVAFGGGFKKHVKKVMSKAVDALDEDITKNMSLTDHTLRQLALLGHPYARRHGEQGKKIHDPNWLVHTHSGKLLSSKHKGVSDADITSGRLSITGYVGLDDAVANYASAIIWGTSKMIPRNFLLGTLGQKRTQDEINNILRNNLRDFVINFRGSIS